jgi:hypothetical protein
MPHASKSLTECISAEQATNPKILVGDIASASHPLKVQLNVHLAQQTRQVWSVVLVPVTNRIVGGCATGCCPAGRQQFHSVYGDMQLHCRFLG